MAFATSPSRTRAAATSAERCCNACGSASNKVGSGLSGSLSSAAASSAAGSSGWLMASSSKCCVPRSCCSAVPRSRTRPMAKALAGVVGVPWRQASAALPSPRDASPWASVSQSSWFKPSPLILLQASLSCEAAPGHRAPHRARCKAASACLGDSVLVSAAAARAAGWPGCCRNRSVWSAGLACPR